MRFGKRLFLFSIIVLVIGLLNFLSRKNSAYGYADVVSYNRIYSVKEQLRILHVVKTGTDSLSILFAGERIKKQNHFEVYCGAAKLADQWGPILTIKPFQEFREYQIKINSTDSLSMNIEFPPGKAPVEISVSGLLINDEDLPGYDIWVRDYFPGPGISSAREVENYLTDSMKILPTDPATEKVIKISKYILSLTAGKYGTPSDSMNALQPIEQLNCVRSGRSLLYCGNFATIFAFFSNNAGVPARFIETGVKADNVVNGEHVFNEVYLRDCDRWVYVDLTDGNVFVQKNGRFLNAVDIQRLLRYEGQDTGFVALHYQRDTLVRLPFRDASFFARSCFNNSNAFVYYYGNYPELTTPANPIQKLKNFLYPGLYYAVYSDNISPPNYSFYLRLGSNYLFAACLVIWICWTGMSVLRYLLRHRLKSISGRYRASA